jgi:hypothetical protein
MFAIDDATVIATENSPLFSIFPGGPSTDIAVTVIDTSTLSTIGGTVFTPAIGIRTSFLPLPTLAPTTTQDSLVSPTASDNEPTSTDTSTSLPEAGDNKGLSTGARVGIGIGVGLSVLVVVAAIVEMVWRKRRAAPKDDTIPLNDVKAWGLR